MLMVFPYRDPNLWLVKCRMGEEKSTAIALMRKFIAYQFSDEVMIIFTDYVHYCFNLLVITTSC